MSCYRDHYKHRVNQRLAGGLYRIQLSSSHHYRHSDHFVLDLLIDHLASVY